MFLALYSFMSEQYISHQIKNWRKKNLPPCGRRPLDKQNDACIVTDERYYESSHSLQIEYHIFLFKSTIFEQNQTKLKIKICLKTKHVLFVGILTPIFISS